jgi:helicase
MPEVYKVGDQSQLVPTSKYKYAKFPFENFNVVQSRVFEFHDKECNAAIAAKTSAGKTVCAEMLLAHEVRKRGGKGMYLAPLKALAQEKSDDWTDPDHHFHDLNVSICTGDYLLTPKRKQELNDADLILMSSEMLNSRGRNYAAEHNNWLKDVGTLVVDESHLLTVPGRGDHLESGLMKFSKINPNGRIVLLSATMPNVDQISGWVSGLTGRDTYFLESEYRPCPLHTHYERYEDDAYSYEGKEEAKVYKALDIIDGNGGDKFLVFGHTKKTVQMMFERLKRAGYNCEMHTADLDKRKRKDVESRFKNDPKLQVVVATSTLAWGLNLPARRVIILGVHRGLQEVPVYDIEQMKGRAGRPQFDPAGDVYVLLPRSAMSEQVFRLQQPQRIESQLFNPKNARCNKVLAFHLVSEIHHKDVETREQVQDWYEDTLASYQNRSLEEHVVENTLTDLIRCGAVKEEDERLKAGVTGKIASVFYYSPFDVADLAKNFSRLFKDGKDDDDHWIAAALAWTDTHRFQIVSNAEKEELGAFQGKLFKSGAMKAIAPNGWFSDGATKVAYSYYCLLRGINSATFGGLMSGLKFDFGRVKQVLQALDMMGYKWGMREWFIQLEQRVRTGVPIELLDLARLDGIAKVKAQKLYDNGMKTAAQVGAAPAEKIIRAIGCTKKTAEALILNAKELANGTG